MTGLALALVLGSSFFHAYWNFLMKRSRDTVAFSWGLLAVSTVVYLPLAIWRAGTVALPADAWFWLAGTVALHTLYFWALGRAYNAGDLSIVYPLARGMGPLLVPILAVGLLGERMTPLAAVGAFFVTAGVYVLHLRGLRAWAWLDPIRGLRANASRFALLTGITIAIYSLWDKQAMARVDPLLYTYGLFAGTAIGLAPIILLDRRRDVPGEWRRGRASIVLAGILSPLTYGLILAAYTVSPVSYVVPLREVGIVWGALLGTIILREPYGRQRLTGSAIIFAGVLCLAVG